MPAGPYLRTGFWFATIFAYLSGTLRLFLKSRGMKRYITMFLVAALTIVAASSCSTPYRLRSFVNRTERNCDRYRPRRWIASVDRYETLVKDYVRNYHRYSTHEKKVAMEAIGRYHALLVQNGLKESMGVVYDLKSILPAYLGGLLDVFRKDVIAFSDFLGNVLGYSPEEINRIVERLKRYQLPR
jgi:hypothetical protein